MYSIEYIDSVDPIERSHYDSFFTEFCEGIDPVSLERIDTQRALSLVGKGIENRIIAFTEYGMESREEFFWKWRCHVILLGSTVPRRHHGMSQYCGWIFYPNLRDSHNQQSPCTIHEKTSACEQP